MDTLISIADGARRLGISTWTLRRLLKAGAIRSVRVSKRVLISESELARVILHGVPVVKSK